MTNKSMGPTEIACSLEGGALIGFGYYEPMPFADDLVLKRASVDTDGWLHTFSLSIGQDTALFFRSENGQTVGFNVVERVQDGALLTQNAEVIKEGSALFTRIVNVLYRGDTGCGPTLSLNAGEFCAATSKQIRAAVRQRRWAPVTVAELLDEEVVPRSVRGIA